MNAIYLTLPLPPLLNRYYRKYRNKMTLSDEGIAFKAEVALRCRLAGITPLQGDVEVIARVYRQRNAGDIDGYQKAALDALQGFAYENDKQVASETFTRDKDAKNPRLEIIIRSYTDDRTAWQQLFANRNTSETLEGNLSLRDNHPAAVTGSDDPRNQRQKRGAGT